MPWRLLPLAFIRRGANARFPARAGAYAATARRRCALYLRSSCRTCRRPHGEGIHAVVIGPLQDCRWRVRVAQERALPPRLRVDQIANAVAPVAVEDDVLDVGPC